MLCEVSEAVDLWMHRQPFHRVGRDANADECPVARVTTHLG